MKLAIGTAQFGLSYGIANQLGQIGKDESFEILKYAESKEVDTLDTAVSYGDSEQRLGQLGVKKWQVISKIPEIPEACQDISSWIETVVFSSLERLKIPKLSGLLLHQPHQLLGSQGKEIFNSLNKLKDKGIIDKTGISIYSPADLDVVWPKFKFDIVQAPYSIFDRRISSSGWVKNLSSAGVELHVRSVFLQGLLLMDSAKRPKKFEQWNDLWGSWEHWLEEQNLTALEACLRFALDNPNIERVLVGVDSLLQLKQIIAASNNKQDIVFPNSLSTEDVELLNPVNWLKQ